jgi:hypothetical protein
MRSATDLNQTYLPNFHNTIFSLQGVADFSIVERIASIVVLVSFVFIIHDIFMFDFSKSYCLLFLIMTMVRCFEKYRFQGV